MVKTGEFDFSYYGYVYVLFIAYFELNKQTTWTKKVFQIIYLHSSVVNTGLRRKTAALLISDHWAVFTFLFPGQGKYIVIRENWWELNDWNNQNLRKENCNALVGQLRILECIVSMNLKYVKLSNKSRWVRNDIFFNT